MDKIRNTEGEIRMGLNLEQHQILGLYQSRLHNFEGSQEEVNALQYCVGILKEHLILNVPEYRAEELYEFLKRSEDGLKLWEVHKSGVLNRELSANEGLLLLNFELLNLGYYDSLLKKESDVA